MIDKVKEWVFEGEMDGFDTLAAEEIGWKPYVVADPWYDDEQLGFDYMSLLKGAGGMLSGAGGMMGTPGGAPAAPSAESQMLALQKAQAESSARTWKIVGGIALALVGIGGIALVVRK